MSIAQKILWHNSLQFNAKIDKPTVALLPGSLRDVLRQREMVVWQVKNDSDKTVA